ncbi:MAG: DUF6377 domain-containing protein [Rikenellaceae bacterium]
MKLNRIYIIATIFSILSINCNAQNFRSLTDSLELSISKRDHYFEQKREKIESLEEKILKINDKRERLELCFEIFTLSRSYRYDVAYKYANEALNIATELGEADLMCRAMAYRISSLTSGGLFTEAAQAVSLANTINVTDQNIKRKLFYNIARYYSDQADFTLESEHHAGYIEKLQNYCDSIILLSANKDYYYTYAKAYKELSVENYNSSIAVLTDFYKNIEEGSSDSEYIDEHRNAIVAFLLGISYFELGDEENGLKYLTKSVDHDIKAVNRENLSIRTIAQHLFERGEEDIAEKLINVALSDATFYNARHRSVGINTILPMIKKYRIDTVSRQRNTVYIFLVIVTILGALAIVSGIIARNNAKIIQKSKRIIEKQIESLSAVNKKLLESNSIKEYYIIESLYKKNEHLEQVEQLLKKIDTKLKNRLYDDLKYIYKDFNIKNERDRFYADFDEAFLRLFPNFLEEYNSLFLPEDRIVIEDGMELPGEVRIYALMRLGITENERISRFLDLSKNTIYTYKTKVKNKSIVPKDEFEKRIFEIRLG